MKLYIHHMPAAQKIDLKNLPFDKDHEGHSFIFAFLQQLFVQFSQISTSILCTDGLPYTSSPNSFQFRLNSNPTAANGLLVGTGSTPPQPNDYKLQTIIGHGNGAGQLAYSPVLFSAPWVATPNVYAAVHRIFTNNSGAPITVREVGIYSMLYSSTPYPHALITRDILAAPATIQNGQAYRFIITFCTPVG